MEQVYDFGEALFSMNRRLESAHLAPPPPNTSAMVFPVRTRASREKSLCLSGVFSNTFSYKSRWVKTESNQNVTLFPWQLAKPQSASYQFGGAASGKNPTGTFEVKMPRAPAPHVQPLDCPGWTRSVLFMQEDQLFQSPNSSVLQHLFQLEGEVKQIQFERLKRSLR